MIELLEEAIAPAAASRVGASIRQAMEVLRHFPYAGHPGSYTKSIRPKKA
jgi:plasmid stabilization system protein ParE